MDEDIARRIHELVEEEHALTRSTTVHPTTTDEDHARIRALEVQLDQCWDLLRQRRARRGAGLDPDGAEVRDADVVEHYRQ